MGKEIRETNKARRQARRARKKEIKKVGVENYSQDGYHKGEFDKKGDSKEYGKVNVNIQDGTITETEDVETDKKD